MGVFGAVFGHRGDAGFNGPLLEASSGAVGFNVAMSLHPVRDIFRPAWPDVCVSAKKFALHAQNTPKSAFLRLLGEFFRGSAAGGASLGEFFRGNVAGGGVLGELCLAVGLAAEPFYWRPSDTQLNPIGGMVGRPPRPPPQGLTCELKGPRAYHRAQVRSDRHAGDDSDEPKQCRMQFPC